jgi:DNA-binding IclR family transcriptional regulator
MKSKNSDARAPENAWTFLTNHAHVLLCLAEKPDMLLREVAATVGITERAVQKIVADLESGGVLKRERHGRRNSYEIDATIHLRHPVESHCTLSGLIRFVLDGKPDP